MIPRSSSRTLSSSVSLTHRATLLASGRAHRAHGSAVAAIGAARVKLARGCAPLASYCLSSPVLGVCLGLLMLTGLASRATLSLAHQSRQAHGRGPPLPPPPSLATALVPTSYTTWCTQSTWARRCPRPRRSRHRRRTLVVAPLSPASVSLAGGPRVSAVRRGREARRDPTTGQAGLAGYAGLAGRLSSRMEMGLGFIFVSFLFFSTDLMLDSKLHIS
jgi:hypothetical protein